MRYLLLFALALATPWSAQAVGIGSVGQPSVVPNANVAASMPGATKPASAAPASTADTGPIIHRFEYDAVGNRTRHIDAENRATRWEHDKAGRVTARILPGGQRETMEYNLVGELVAKTDFLGRTTRYTYDRAGRVDSIDYPGDGDVTLTYTRMGLRETVTDGHGTTRYSYNRRDRLTGVEFPHGEAVAYEYDAAQNRTALVTAHQRVTYTYDPRNRLETVTAAHGTTRYTYDAVGNRASVVRPNGIRTEYAYDGRNRLTGLAHRRASDGTLLFGVTYTLESDGQRSAAEERDAAGVTRTISWAYDNARRLVGETIIARDPTQSRSATWTYDKVGNRLTQVLTIGINTLTTDYVYDTNDRLLTETTGAAITRYAYDANGNTRSRSSASGVVEYAYDDQDRLIEQRDATGRRAYRYDADGLRIGETFFPVSGLPISTSYVFDKSRDSATVIEEFVQEGQGARLLVATFTYGDDLISQTRAAGTHFLHADGMGSTRLLTSASGAQTDSCAFDAFGNEIARSGNTTIAHLYRGEQFDPNLGFYYLRARFYDPKTGRFPTMDSFAGFTADPTSLHKYLYAHTDPVNSLDPSGNMTMKEFTMTVNILLNRVLSSASTRAATYYLAAARATGVAVGGLSYLSTRGQGVLIELQASGGAGVQALQSAFLRAQPALTQAQAAMSANWRSFETLKLTMNSTLSGARFNPANFHWHHIVGQTTANVQRFGSNVINSLANVVPISSRVHGVITNFYNSGIVINGQTYSRFQHYVAMQGWQKQSEIGLAILRQASSTGRIDPSTLPL